MKKTNYLKSVARHSAFLPSAFLILSLSLSFAASGHESEFDLVRRNNELCKIEWKANHRLAKPTYCIKLIDPPGAAIDILAQNQFLNHYQKPGSKIKKGSMEYYKEAGGSVALSEEQREYVTNNYSALSLRDIAIDWSKLKMFSDDHSNAALAPLLKVPFLARLFWRGSLNLNGTLLIEGQLELPVDELILALGSQSINSQNGEPLEDRDEETLLKMVRINEYADECLNHENEFLCLRRIGQIARRAHFKILAYKSTQSMEANTDESTEYLLQHIVGKVIVGEFYSRAFYNIHKFFNSLIDETKQIFDKGFGDIW